MNAPHTPGPWLVEGTTVYALTENTGRLRVECPMVNRFTANVQSCNAFDGASQKEIEANATLIAAAPDLLHFAERFVAGVEAHADHELIERLSYHLGNARAAIAKAKGANDENM